MNVYIRLNYSRSFQAGTCVHCYAPICIHFTTTPYIPAFREGLGTRLIISTNRL